MTPEPPHGPAQEIKWEDFRDHLTTADKQGHRQWVYVKKPHGKWTDRRTWLNWLLIGVMFAGPFIRINGNPRHHIAGLTFMLLFTLLFFAIFARFREQACTFICPYGRLQSTMLDENTMIVACDHKRGERRGKLQREQPLVQRIASGHGDCIDCHQCVTVFPTGIDIRNGVH